MHHKNKLFFSKHCKLCGLILLLGIRELRTVQHYYQLFIPHRVRRTLNPPLNTAFPNLFFIQLRLVLTQKNKK